jgi:hypothetical protein
MAMDKQLEEKIRERAYELWVQNGSLPDRADEYWYQAEQEVRAESGSSSAAGDEALDVSSAPLGMTSETSDEILPSPVAPKTRRKRTSAASIPEAPSTPDIAPVSDESASSVLAVPKRKRTARTS